MKIEIINKPNIKVHFDETRRILVQEWVGFTPSADFRHALNISLSFAEINRVDGILSNALKHSPLRPEDVQYAAETIPRFYAAGVKKMAFVIPESAITRLGLKRFESSKPTSIHVEYFSSVVDAMGWMDQILKV